MGATCLSVPSRHIIIPMINLVSGDGLFIGLQCRRVVAEVARCLEGACKTGMQFAKKRSSLSKLHAVSALVGTKCDIKTA